MAGALAKHRLVRLDEVMRGHLDRGEIGAASWYVARGADVHQGACGAAGLDTIFRISSSMRGKSASVIGVGESMS